MGRASHVIVPMSVPRAAPVTMHVEVPGGDRGTARRQVERVIVPCVGMDMIVMGVGVRGTVFVPLLARARVKLTPRTNSDPDSEPHERDTGDDIDGTTEALPSAGADEPYRDAKQERRRDVTRTGLQRHSRRLGSRPTALPGEKRDRRPMIGNHRMEDADANDGGDQQKLLPTEHFLNSRRLHLSQTIRSKPRRAVDHGLSLTRVFLPK